MISVLDLFRAEGEAKGLAKGKAEGKAEGMATIIVDCVLDGLLTREIAVLRLRHLHDQGALPDPFFTTALRQLDAD